MDAKTIVVSVVSIAIACLFAVTLLIPVIAESTTTEDTFTNEGLWRMKEIETGDVWKRVDNAGGGYKWTLNDVDQTTIANQDSNTVLGVEWCVRSNGQARGHTVGGNVTYITATTTDNNVLLSGGGINGSGSQTKTGYGIDINGDYLMKRYDNTSYVKGDSEIFGTGQSTVDSVRVIIHVVGTVDDGATITLDSAYDNSGTATVTNFVATNVVVNNTAVDGYLDLYSFTSITADVSFDYTPYGSEETTTKTGSITYSSVVVPYEVTAERSIHPDANTSAILNLIPLLVIVGIILATVGFIAFRK